MTTRRQPGRRGARARTTPRDPDLLFCANCNVSIAQAEIESGKVRQTAAGGLLCVLCARATPERRRARRAALEEEFADEAKVPLPISDAVPVAPPAPRDSSLGRDDQFQARVARLERLVFDLEGRIRALELGRQPGDT